MRYSGIQPQYFPRLHYFARILNTDVFVIRDDAQFVAKHKYPDGKTGSSYQAHSPIKQVFGTDYLKIPIKHEGRNPIAQTKTASEIDWQTAHLKTLQTSYGKAKNFAQIYPEVEKLIRAEYTSLAELNTATICWGLLHLLGDVVKADAPIEEVVEKLKKSEFRLKKIILGSTLSSFTDNTIEDKNMRIVRAIKEVGANEDYCGATAFDAYMDETLFEKNGIKITVQEWKCNEYTQLFAKQQSFIPNLSIIDLLMNVDRDDAVNILWKNSK